MMKNKLKVIMLCLIAVMGFSNILETSAKPWMPSVSGAVSIIQPFMPKKGASAAQKDQSAMTIVGLLTNKNYATSTNWKNCVCPALAQLNVSRDFAQRIASRMGYSYPC